MNIRQLSIASGVTVRNIRLYIHQRLLEPPQGRTRAARYTDHHCQDLARISALRKAGWPTDQIRAELALQSAQAAVHRSEEGADVDLQCCVERRYMIGPGIALVFLATAREPPDRQRRLIEQVRAALRGAAGSGDR